MSYTEKRKTTSKLILITLYSAFVGSLLGDIQSIANWNYNLHEMLSVPVLGIYLLPLELVIWIYYSSRSIKERKEKNTKLDIKSYTKNLVIFLSVILILVYFNILFTRFTIGGVFEVDRKIIENHDYYYIIINNAKVKCTENEYNLIEEGRKYLISYKSNEKWPHKGKLESITY